MPAGKIRELPEEDRPREKLEEKGASALTVPELLALIVGTGTKGVNVVELCSELLKDKGSLRALSRCSYKELQEQRGIGPAKAFQLAAIFELGHRIARETVAEEKIDTPDKVVALLGNELRAQRREVLRVILLNTRYHLIKVAEASAGSVNESIAHPREIFQPAVAFSAYAIIVVHNHPSGDASPSQADHQLTRRLAEAAALMQIRLLDHIIIGSPSPASPGYFSFKEAGVL